MKQWRIFFLRNKIPNQLLLGNRYYMLFQYIFGIHPLKTNLISNKSYICDVRVVDMFKLHNYQFYRV